MRPSARTCHVCLLHKSKKSLDTISLARAARAERAATSPPSRGDTAEAQGEEMSCDRNRSVSTRVVSG